MYKSGTPYRCDHYNQDPRSIVCFLVAVVVVAVDAAVVFVVVVGIML